MRMHNSRQRQLANAKRKGNPQSSWGRSFLHPQDLGANAEIHVAGGKSDEDFIADAIRGGSVSVETYH
jgi:hypothetical protein